MLMIMIRLVLGISLAAAIVSGTHGATVSGSEGSDANSMPALEQAKRAVDEDDLAGAEALLWRALAERPEDQSVRYLLARVLSWRGDFPVAQEQFDQLLAQSPDNADYLLGKAQSYIWGGEPRWALPLLQRARALAPEYFEVWQAEVQALMATGEVDARIQAQELASASSGHLSPEQSSRLTALANPVAQTSGFTEIALGAGRQFLDNDRDPWSSLELDLSHRFAQGATVYGAVRATERFDQRDNTFVAGFYYPVAQGWLAQAEATYSPDYNVVPKWSLYGRVSRELGSGWNLGVAFRHNVYRTSRVDTGSLSIERYWSVFRAAYTVYASSVEGEIPVYSHAADLDYYYDDLSYVGASGGRGREAEFINGTRLVVRRTNSLALRGRHWLDPRWAVEYAMNRSRIEGAFTRYGVRLGIRYRY